jgi:hypothetical protein
MRWSMRRTTGVTELLPNLRACISAGSALEAPALATRVLEVVWFEGELVELSIFS